MVTTKDANKITTKDVPDAPKNFENIVSLISNDKNISFNVCQQHNESNLLSYLHVAAYSYLIEPLIQLTSKGHYIIRTSLTIKSIQKYSPKTTAVAL